MFKLSPAPTYMQLNEYVIKYKETGDFQYFRFFLHVYERNLNKKVDSICEKYEQERNFEDMKQTIVATLLGLLPKYNLDFDVKFLSFAKKYVDAAVHHYIRLHGGAHVVENDNQYRDMIKATAIYYRDMEKSPQERFEITVREMKMEAEDVGLLLAEGEHFKYYDSIYMDTVNDFGEPDFEEWVGDEYSNPANLVPSFLLYDDMIGAVENLMYREQQILLRRWGILCLYCGRVERKLKKTPKEQIANHFELYSDSAVDRALTKAEAELAKELTAKGWFRAMNIKQESKTVKNGKIVTATFSYRPMFGTDEGLLEFDVTRPAEKGYIIDRFTPQDRQYPFFRQLAREVAMMQKAGFYYKEKLVVWWA